MIKSDAVQLPCRGFRRLKPIDALGLLEEKSSVYQNGGESWATVPQKGEAPGVGTL